MIELKKNGFTLIELLAVIVIVGLLVVLVSSKVKPAVNDSNFSVNLASANNLVNALEEYYFQAKLNGGFTGCNYNFSNNSNSCSVFSFSGSKPTGGVLSLSADGVISGNIIFDEQYEFTVSNNKVIE